MHTPQVWHPMVFDKYRICVTQVLAKTQNIPISPAVPRDSFIPTASEATLSWFFVRTTISLACFRTSYKWNHTARALT